MSDWYQVKAILEKLSEDEQWLRLGELPPDCVQNFLDWKFPRKGPLLCSEAEAQEKIARTRAAGMDELADQLERNLRNPSHGEIIGGGEAEKE